MSTREELARWEAWCSKREPLSTPEGAALQRLRERWPLDGGGDGPRDFLALNWKAPT